MEPATELSSEVLRKRLIERRQSVLGLLGKLRDARKHPLQEGTELVTDLELAAQVRVAEHRLTESDEALERLEMGIYGVCEACGKRISPDRLDALPSTGWCRYCA